MQRCSRCLSLLIQHVSHPVSPFVVLFNLFDCIFLQLNTVVIHHCVLAANFCLCFWLLGFGPFSCWFAVSFGETQIWLGDLRVVLVGSLCDGFDEWPLYM